jgi:5-methylcytosine-specific restriction endonuclease McrA
MLSYCLRHGLHPQGHCRACKAEREQHRSRQPHKRAHHTAAHRILKAQALERDSACVDCGTLSDLTLDYLTPLQDGGEQVLANVAVRCRSCNASKGRRRVSSDTPRTHAPLLL